MAHPVRHILYFALGLFILSEGNAQDRTSPDARNATDPGDAAEVVLLGDALDKLSTRFNAGFLYRAEVVNAKKVHFRENASLAESLDALLIQHDLVAIRIGEQSFVIVPYDERALVSGLEIIGGLASSRLARINGSVRDRSGHELPGAVVIVEGAGAGDVAAFDGAFDIKGLQPGMYEVKASYLGYRSALTTVRVEAGQSVEIDFELARDILQLEAIVTTATRRARAPRESAVSLSVVQGSELERLAPNSQADILRGIPGVHSEGGGGAVHANVFIRGLPAPGQYKYSSVHEDGMPVISESRITGSAIDAYFRYDLGIQQMEFARGGSTALYGVASPVGIVNYISKTGGDENRTVFQTTVGDHNLYRFDFNTNGPISRKIRFSLSGFYRYDEGPVVTGLPTDGVQFKGNITHFASDGYIRVYGKYLNDRAQFFLPFPHETANNEPATGADGELITTLNARQGADFSFRSPSGTFESEMENGIMTRGSSVMIEFMKEWKNDLRLESKTRWSDYYYEANIFLPFPAFNHRDEYAAPFLDGSDARQARYFYTDTGEPYTGPYVIDQGAFHWVRPIKDLASRFQMSDSFEAGSTRHDLAAGVYLSRTSVRQLDIEPWILTEFADRPRLLDLAIDDAGNDGLWGTEDDLEIGVTQNGLASASRNYANVHVQSNRIAIFAGDEATIANRIRLDVGIRFEIRNANFSTESAEPAGLEGEFGDNQAVRGFLWGNGRFRQEVIRSRDLASSIGLNYTLLPALNVYVAASRSHFFPELSALTSSVTEIGEVDNERFYQFETGFKYNAGRFASTLALYLAKLDDRLALDIRADEQGTVRNRPVKIGGSRTLGAEWTWGFVPTGLEVLHLFGDVTYQHHAYRDFILGDLNFSGNQIERQPKFMSNIGLDYEKAAVNLSVQAKYIGDRFASADNLHRLDAYTLIQLDAGYTISLGPHQTLRAGFHVFNLLNSRGLTEGDPRLLPGTSIRDQPYFNARPVLPRRVLVRLAYSF